VTFPSRRDFKWRNSLDGSRRCHSRSFVVEAFVFVPSAETSDEDEDEDEDDDAIDDSDAAALVDKGSVAEAPRRNNGSHAIRTFILEGTAMVGQVPYLPSVVAGGM